MNLVSLTILRAKRRAVSSKRDLAAKKSICYVKQDSENSRNRSECLFTYTRGQKLQAGLVAHAGNPSTQGAGGLCVSGSSGKLCLKSTRSHRLERWLGGSECFSHKDQFGLQRPCWVVCDHLDPLLPSSGYVSRILQGTCLAVMTRANSSHVYYIALFST